ncbi:MAG: propanediol/glycerol family dehydratase large subunit, partial [Pseudomonadota bacterium]
MAQDPSHRSGSPNRWRRFAQWDERPLRLDRFAVRDDDNGFVAMDGAHDPAPSLDIASDIASDGTGGRVVAMDGKPVAEFDLIDHYIARHHLDLEVAPEAMALPSAEVARMLVDISVPRAQLTRLARGMTPAKLAQVVAELTAMELAFAYAKMRARKTPGNQAHVTNAKDDPLQLAADAATAVAFGFDEIETTMRVSRNSWSNALACCVG